MSDTKPSVGTELVTRWSEDICLGDDIVGVLPIPWARMAYNIDMAVDQARREGARAMREATADKCLEVRSLAPRPGSYGDGWTDAADTIENAVDALPLPGDAS